MLRAASPETRARSRAEDASNHSAGANSAVSLKNLRSTKTSTRPEAASLRKRAVSLHSARQLPPELQELHHAESAPYFDSAAEDEISSLSSFAGPAATPTRTPRKLHSARKERGMGKLAASASSLEPPSSGKSDMGPLSARKVLGERGHRLAPAPESASSGGELPSPSQPSRSRSAASGAKVVPPELGFLYDFALGGPDQFALIHPEWTDFAAKLRASVEFQVELHVKTCSKCRAFSSFAKHVKTQKKPSLNEFTLASLCKEQLKVLNRHVGDAVLQEKDDMLAVMAESLCVPVDDLISYEAVTKHRLDPRSSSFALFAAEKERVLEQAHMRQELNQVIAMMRHVKVACHAWRKAATRFRGGVIPHKRMSVVNSEDVEECATEQLHDLTIQAAVLTEAWKKKWKPLTFNEVFSIFGIPLVDQDEIPSGAQPRPGGSAWAKTDLDQAPVPVHELATLRPMSISVRVRPQLSHEAGDACIASVLEDGLTVSFKDAVGPGSGSHRLAFDAAIQGSQEDMFSRCGVKKLVHKALEGHTATVFAYGQTGTGKTHSLLGPEGSIMQLSEDEVIDEQGILSPGCKKLVDDARCCKVAKQGLLPRAVQFLWKLLQKGQNAPTVRVSFLELYNEQVYDLLNPSGKLDVRQKSANEQGFHVPGLTVCEATSPEIVLNALRQGVGTRHTQGHSMSRDSSRGHAIFTIELARTGPGEKSGKLIFADLAGSERQKRVQGANITESANINKSLFALSNCISALASGNESSVSSAFRNSKLTKLLMGSLCGQGFTLLIAAVSPAARNFDETASTLFFAAKCANIKRQLAPNLTAHQREVQELKATVEALREQLAKATQGTNGAIGIRMDSTTGNEAAADQGGANQALQEELEDLREELQEEQRKRAALEQQVQESELLREELDIERRRGRALQREIKDTVIELKAECREQVQAARGEVVPVGNQRGVPDSELDLQYMKITSLERELDAERQRSAVLEQEIQAVGALAAAELEALCKDLEAERQRSGVLQHENEFMKKELEDAARRPDRPRNSHPHVAEATEEEGKMHVQVYMLEEPEAHSLRMSPVSPDSGGASDSVPLPGKRNSSSSRSSSEDALEPQQDVHRESLSSHGRGSVCSQGEASVSSQESELSQIEVYELETPAALRTSPINPTPHVLQSTPVALKTSPIPPTPLPHLQSTPVALKTSPIPPTPLPQIIESNTPAGLHTSPITSTPQVYDLNTPAGLRTSPISATPQVVDEPMLNRSVAKDLSSTQDLANEVAELRNMVSKLEEEDFDQGPNNCEFIALTPNLSPNLDLVTVTSGESQGDEEDGAEQDMVIDVDLANQGSASACNSPNESEFSC